MQDSGSLQFFKPSLGDSGHYICRSFAGREVHHYISVLYQPESLRAVHTLYFKMKDPCSTIKPQLDELLEEAKHKVLCKGIEKVMCPYNLARTCENKTPAYGGFKFRLLFNISRPVPMTPKPQLLSLVKHKKMEDLVDVRREKDILMEVGGNETLFNDFVIDFFYKKSLANTVLVDKDKIDARRPNPTFDGTCKYNGSRLLGMLCAPCPPGHYSFKKSPEERTHHHCMACPRRSSQAYFGATNCKSKPSSVLVAASSSLLLPSSTPSPYMVLGINMESAAAMTVPQLGGAVITAIFVVGLLGYLVFAVLKAMIRKSRRAQKVKKLPSYHSLTNEEEDDEEEITKPYSDGIKSYDSITSADN